MIPKSIVFAVSLVLAGSAGNAAAQTWPTRPLRMIVPFTPGGASDVAARILGEQLAAPLGQSVVVDNRTGAAGAIGAEIVARAQPDGYTLLLMDISLPATAALAINKVISTPLRYDALRDFQPVIRVMEIPFTATVHPAVAARTVAEFVTLSKSRRLSFGSAGVGSAAHLAGEMFRTMAGIELVHVPYKGAAAAVADLLGGQIDLTFAAISTTLPHIKAGKLRALGISTLQRSPLLPDTPTVAEAGVPGYDVAFWTGVAAPRDTPAAITARLHDTIAQVLRKPEVAARFTAMGATVTASSQADAARYVEAELRKWTELVKKIGLTAE